MPDPQEQNSTSVQTPPPEPVTNGVDLSGLRFRTIQEAKAALPQPQLAPPWEDEPRLQSAPTSKLGKAYADAKQWLSDHEQHVSEKYLAPFREGLDRLGEDLQQAGESGHTPTGGALAGPTRALASGVGTLLKQVPVGRNVKETIQMSLTPPEFGPEGKALSKELNATQKTESAIDLSGLRTRAVSKTEVPQKSPFRIAAETPDKVSDFHSAVQNTEGAELSDSGLTLDVVRHQKPEQAGEKAIRTGVFFLPEKKSPYQRYYTTGRQGYGGTQRIEGRTTFENPIIAKGASGGKVPERAYDAINGQGAYDEMRQDVLDATVHGWGPKNDAELTQNVANVLEQYGGNPDLAEDIVRNSKGGNTLPYAIQEHIVASSVRKAGHDGIIGFSKTKGQPRLSEVFDLRHDKYPISSQLFESKYQPSKTAKAPEPEIPWDGDGRIGDFPGRDPGGKLSEIQKVDIDKLQPTEKPDPETVKSLKDQFLYDTDQRPIPALVVEENGDGTFSVIDGHSRLEAARAVGYKQAPVRVYTSPDDLRTGSETPASIQKSPAEKSRERQLNLKNVGIGLTEMDPADAKNWVGYTNQKSLKIYRGVDDPSHAIEAGDYVTTSKESAQNYGKHVQELEVSPAELRYVRGHKDGDPLKLDQGGQTELIYAPKAGKKVPPQSEPQNKAERRAGVGGYSGDSPTESQFVQKVIQGAKDTEPWAPADMGDGGKAWLDKDGKYIPQDKEHQDIAENFWNRRIRIGNLEGKGPLLVHAEGAPSEAQRKAIAADIKKQGGAIYDLKKDGNNITGEAKTVGDFLRAIDSTWKPETVTKIDLSGLRVRLVKAGRQAAGMDTFIASDGRKYQFPSSDATWEKILKVDPGAKRIK